MAQERIDHPVSGEKIYVPWSFWNDGRWRRCEPEGEGKGLLLYGLEQLKDHGTVWLHEGAKAARRCQEIRDTPELLAKLTLGERTWKTSPMLDGATGAPNPDRCDWSALQGVGTVVIVWR